MEFFIRFSSMTLDYHYDVAILLLSPFMSRERFWYFLISVQVATFFKTNMKMMISEPRPYWVWTDIFSEFSCTTSFGSPSGHSIKSSNFAFLVILDLFFASEWSRQTYRHSLNQMRASTSKVRFGLISLLCVGLWLLIAYERILLGMHTLNQVFFGSQVGIWCAFFTHFCMRDLIFRHITQLTREKADEHIKAFKYILSASLIALTCLLLTMITGLVMVSDLAGGSKVEPQRFLNIRDFYCPTF